MANVVIVGMQWGDEGKGKIVDLLCPAFDVVARYQGGHNAGHTVKFGARHFALNLIPSGVLHPGTLCVLGNGMVVDPEAFFGELGRLREAGVNAEGRLFVSNRAHVLLPPHAALDQAREAARGGKKIGTTGKGIGPAYEGKPARIGLRMADLGAPDLEDRLRILLSEIEGELLAIGGQPLGHPGPLADLCRHWRDKLKPYLRDTEHLLNGFIRTGKSVLFEGAQGTLLDVDHGTYPYVTSSSAGAGGACSGTGVPPTRIQGSIGVLKAYTTRVGGGPFPTELEDQTGEFLRARGNEYGTVTRRPRRCGWLDLFAARYAVMLNGVDTIALTKLDVLDDQPAIRVCVGYRYRGETLTEFPAELNVLENCEPVYKTFEGWMKSTVGALDDGDLPAAARDYIRMIENELGVPVTMISTGPRREETIVREAPTLARLTSGRLGAVIDQRQSG
jgi:adenylosuccinate synthase